MMAHDRDRIGDMKQQQASGDGVEWLGVTPVRDVTLGEDETSVAASAAPGFFKDVRRLIEADDRSVRTNQLCDELRDVAEAGTEIEDAGIGSDSRRAQQQTRRGFDAFRLRVEAREFLSMAAQDVFSS